MAIEGLLGFRSNLWKFEDDQWIICSASRKEFVWDTGIVQARCNRIDMREFYHPDQVHDCYYDDLGYLVPDERCSCGIYATLSKGTLRSYVKSPLNVVYLVEQLGGFVACYDSYLAGWRGGGAQIVAVVTFDEYQLGNILSHSPYEMALAAASQKFNVPVLPYSYAVQMAKIQWEKEELEWTSDLEMSWDLPIYMR